MTSVRTSVIFTAPVDGLVFGRCGRTDSMAMSRLSMSASSCSKFTYSTYACPEAAMLRAIWRAIVVLPVPWAPPMSISSPGRSPPPSIRSSGAMPSGTGSNSARSPAATRCRTSVSTSSAERGAIDPDPVSRIHSSAAGTAVLVAARSRPPFTTSSPPIRAASACRGAEIVPQSADGANSCLIVQQDHRFVRGVGVAVGVREAEHHDRVPEAVTQLRRDRDRAAGPDRQRRRSEGGLERVPGRERDRVADLGAQRLRGAEVPDLDADALRRDLDDVVAQRLEQLLAVLVRHQPAAQLRVSVGRDDRLRALAGEATPDAVHVERRADAGALEDREAGLAIDERCDPDLAPERLLVERQAADLEAVLLRGWEDAGVEARDPDGPVVGLQLGDDPSERVGGVRHGAAEAARVKVDGRAVDVDLGVEQAAQRRRQGRQVALEEAGVADQDGVGLEPVAIGLDPRRQALR